jgi:anti-sigma B factor antagonist
VVHGLRPVRADEGRDSRYFVVVSEMSRGFDLDLTVHPTGITLSVRGDLDLATAPTLVQRVATVDAEPGAEFTVDLTNVGFCDSAGINALVGLRKRCDAHGWLLKVVHPQPTVRRMLVDFTGLGDYLNVR